ncbi:hypothetical protein HID58_070354 [Brassica napus]|uniref:FACT complex subunit n=1 Tax=Brassica napus TaxID=3708 RepID=A0ABQ7YYK8_BRANA|nr:hypothetical protein HID58_070354 [Brassica napus]
MVAGAKVCGVPDGMRSTVIHLPSHLSISHGNDILFLMRYTHFPLYRAAVLKEKCKIDLCVMRITGSKGESADADTASCYYDWLLLLRGIHVVTTTQEISESKDQRSLKKIVHTFMKDDGGEQYLRLPTAVVVVVTAKTYHKMLFMF